MKPGLRLFCSKLNCDNFSYYNNLCLPFCKTISVPLGYWSLLAWPCFGFKMTACTEKSSRSSCTFIAFMASSLRVDFQCGVIFTCVRG